MRVAAGIEILWQTDFMRLEIYLCLIRSDVPSLLKNKQTERRNGMERLRERGSGRREPLMIEQCTGNERGGGARPDPHAVVNAESHFRFGSSPLRDWTSRRRTGCGLTWQWRMLAERYGRSPPRNALWSHLHLHQCKTPPRKLIDTLTRHHD